MLQIHIDRLTQTLADIKSNPNHHYQATYHYGTLHCFAGFAEVRRNLKVGQSMADGLLIDYGSQNLCYEINDEYFGLMPDGWNAIMDTSNTVETLELMVHAAIRGNGTIDLSDMNLTGADLRGAKLRLANLRGTNFEGANLEGASLRGANLEGANLKDANLEGADLENASFVGQDHD